MEPNLNAFMQWNIMTRGELRAGAATEVDMDSLTAATSADMSAVTYADSCAGNSCVADDTDYIQAVDDPDQWVISSGDVTWSTISMNLGDLEISGDLTCEPNQFLTVKDSKMVCAEPHYTTEIQSITIIKEVPMWTISNILIVAIIAAVVFKMMPKLTLYNFFKAVWKLIIRPFQRKEKEISNEWDRAEKDTKE